MIVILNYEDLLKLNDKNIKVNLLNSYLSVNIFVLKLEISRKSEVNILYLIALSLLVKFNY